MSNVDKLLFRRRAFTGLRFYTKLLPNKQMLQKIEAMTPFDNYVYTVSKM